MGFLITWLIFMRYQLLFNIHVYAYTVSWLVFMYMLLVKIKFKWKFFLTSEVDSLFVLSLIHELVLEHWQRELRIKLL